MEIEMKKIKLLLMTVLLLAALATSAYAGNTYDIPELKMSLEAPEDWVTMTRNADDNAEAETMLGVGSAALIDFLVQSHIYIDFVTQDGMQEIFVTMFENEDAEKIISINEWSNDQLEQFAESVSGTTIDELHQELEDMNFEGIAADEVQWTGYEVYEHEQIKYIKIYNTKSINGITASGLQYYTVQNSQMINISVASYDSEISDSLEATAKEVVDSLVFTELAEGKAPIDFYSIVRTTLLWACIAFTIFGLIVIVRSRKQKKKIATPPSSTFPTDNNTQS